MKKNMIKIMALIALFGIIIGVAGTGILIIFESNSNNNVPSELTPEKLQELQEMFNSGAVLNTGSGEVEE